MFDTMVPDLGKLADASDGTVAAAITEWARIEAAAAARRLAAVAELVRRRTDVPVGRSRWACDDWDATAAEVAAALHLSHGKASSQMYLALALRERLPRVAQVFADGMISAAVVATIAWHSTLIDDPQALALADKALADDALRYGRLSAAKTDEAIDAIIDRHDPGALRNTRGYVRSRDVVIDRSNTASGTTPLWGRLYAADAELLDRRLMAMAHQVCDDDPRTIAQRRADALGALAAGADRLVCICTDPDCPTKTGDAPPRTGAVVIHVVANADTIEATTDPYHHGEAPPSRPITPDMTLTEALTPDPQPDPPAVRKPPALILGGPLIPAALLAELIAIGAKVRSLVLPGLDSPPEPGYRPSTALDEFIRCRDMTCRFPGCDKPAEFCDIDHAIAYGDGGQTHPSNLRCLCRKHHLLKTFWGWRDQQYPDATIVWTSPAGLTYTTRPGSRLLFPPLCRPTGQLPEPAPGQRTTGRRTLMMPTRKRTRTQDRTGRIKTERALNAAHVAERNQPPPF